MVAPPTYTNHCGGRVLGRRGQAGRRHSALPPTHTHTHTHTHIHLKCGPLCMGALFNGIYWEDVNSTHTARDIASVLFKFTLYDYNII